MASRRRKKKAFRFTRYNALAIAAVFVLSVGLGTFALDASRSSQLALALKPPSCSGAKNKDCPAEVPKKTVYKCDWPAKVTDENDPDKGAQCVKAKPCSEPGGASGKTIQGTCQCPEICKGNPDEATDKNDPGKGGEQPKGDGKAPEMPKMPEPPKDEPPPQGGSPKTNCTGGDESNEKGPGGKDCPGSTNTLGDDMLFGALAPAPPPAPTPTPEPEAPKTIWSAIVTNVSNAAKAVGNAVSSGVQGIVQTAQSFGGNSAPVPTGADTVVYTDSSGQSFVSGQSADTYSKTFSEVTGFTTSGDVGVSADLSGNSQTGGFWSGVAQALKNFLRIF